MSVAPAIAVAAAASGAHATFKMPDHGIVILPHHKHHHHHPIQHAHAHHSHAHTPVAAGNPGALLNVLA